MANLAKLLASVQTELERARPDEAAKLNPGAAKESLAKLPKGEAELAAWFAWHDGQRGTASLSPEDNRYLLSIEDALDAAKFLAEEGTGYEKSWFPLFANGAGDYVVYETAKGKQHGALLAYWHDDDARGVEAASLEAWAEAIHAALKKQPTREAKPKGFDVTKVTLRQDGGWSQIPAPDAAAVEAFAVGTALRIRHYTRLLARGGNKPLAHVYVKVAKDSWLHASIPLDGDVAAVLNERLHEPPQEFPRYSLKKAADMGKMLKKSLVTVDGAEEVPHDEVFAGTMAFD